MLCDGGLVQILVERGRVEGLWTVFFFFLTGLNFIDLE